MNEQERIAIKEVLNEIFVAGDELQTYENLLNKVVELREPVERHANPNFVDMQQKVVADIKKTAIIGNWGNTSCHADPSYGVDINHCSDE